MFEFDEDTETTVETLTTKRDRYGYDYNSTRKAQDRFSSLDRDYRVDRVGKAAKRAARRSENRNAINQAWRSVR